MTTTMPISSAIPTLPRAPATTTKRKTPTDFQVEADAHNARTDEIAGHIVREHETHKKLRDEEDARHAAQLQEYHTQQANHAAARKTLITAAGDFGITATHARAALRKG